MRLLMSGITVKNKAGICKQIIQLTIPKAVRMVGSMGKIARLVRLIFCKWNSRDEFIIQAVQPGLFGCIIASFLMVRVISLVMKRLAGTFIFHTKIG